MQMSERTERPRVESWRLRRGLRIDRLIVLVEQGNAEVEQDLVDRRLVLLDEAVEQPLPVLIGRTDTHADAINEARSRRFLHQRRDMQRRIGLPGVETRHRSPENAGLDLA